MPLVMRTYITQGTPPTVTVRSEARPVRSFWPVMVMTVPPALGPLSGDSAMTNGSLKKKKKEADEKEMTKMRDSSPY